MKGKYKLKKYNMGTQYVDTPNYSSLYNEKARQDGREGMVDGFTALGSQGANATTGALAQSGKAAGSTKLGAGVEGGIVSAGSTALNLAGSALKTNQEKRFDENMKAGRMMDEGAYMRREVGAKAAKRAATGASIGGAIGSIIPGAGTLLGAGIGAGVGGIAGGIEGYATGKGDYNKLATNFRATKDKFENDKKAYSYAVDSTREGDTGVSNYMPQAKNGMQVGKYKYKNGTKGISLAKTIKKNNL